MVVYPLLLPEGLGGGWLRVNQQEGPVAAGDHTGSDAGGPEGIEAGTTVGGQRQDARSGLDAGDDDLGRIAASHLRRHLQITGRVADPSGEPREIVLGAGGLQVQRGSRSPWQ